MDKNHEENNNNTLDMIKFFDTFLKPGTAIIEKEIVPGLQVKIKALTANELIIAESMIRVNNPSIPMDIIQKIRGAAILSQAIIQLNDMVIEREDMDVADNRARREQLYRNLLDFPPIVIAKAYDAYLEAVKMQNDFYEKPSEMKGQIENF